jgi:integrase
MKQLQNISNSSALKTDGLSKNSIKAYTIAYNQFRELSRLSEIEIQGMNEAELGKKIVETFNSNFENARIRPTKISSCKNYIELTYEKSIPIKRDRKAGKHKLRQSNKEDLSNKQIDSIIKEFNKEYKAVMKSKNQNRIVPKLRNLIMIKLLAFTGQRIGDILNLTVKESKRSNLHFKQEKTGNEIEIENPCLLEVLTYIAMTKLDESDYLFKTGFNSKLSYTHALHTINKLSLIATGNKNITPHTFRKYAVTHLKQLGFTDRQVMSVTGHSDSRMISYYTGNEENIQGLQGLLLKPVSI